MSAYTIYKELFPSQTVEHVEQAQFTTPGRTNLIVAKASLLQIYNFVEYTPNTSQPAPDDALRTQEDPTNNNNKDNNDNDDKVMARGKVYTT
jgi:cleavage and polyadenylation specificity factor subunit 1